MTKRKIQHQLEDISRYKYGLALPKQWVFRNKDKDYGIDGEVELFDENENATGLVYWIQLKATQSANVSVIKRIDISIAKLKYYRRLDIPVLLVRYSYVNDEFYVKWAHDVDIYYAKEGAKTMRVKFSDSDKWGDKSPASISNYLKKIRAIKSGALSLPLSFNLQFGDDYICGKSTSILLSGIRQELNNYDDILQLVDSQEKALVDVFIDKNKLQIGLSGLTGCTFHNVDQMYKDSLESDLLKDVMLGIASAVANFGLHDLSARIIFSNDLKSRLSLMPDLMIHLLPKILKTSYFHEALDLASNMADKQDSNFLEMLTHISILFNLKRDNEEKKEAIEKFLIRCISRNKDIDSSLYGISFYNLGNFYRSINRGRDSIKCYLKARRYEPKYYNQDYFYGEMGGSFFEIEKYKLAAYCYKKAIESGGDKEWRPLYADALMFCGEYQKAFDYFQEFLTESNDETPEWHLKLMCLEDLLNTFEIKDQNRNKSKAINLADVSNCQNNEEIEKNLKEALHHDLLCGLAWFNLGHTYSKKNEVEETAFCFTMCALVQSWDIEAWVNATLSSFNKKVPAQIFLLIVRTAYFFNKEEFLSALYKNIDNQHGSEATTEISKAIEQIIPNDVSDKSIPEIRILDKDGKFKDIIKRNSA